MATHQFITFDPSVPFTPGSLIYERILRIHRNVERRAKKFGIPFTIGVLDIPYATHCVYLGVELVYGAGGQRCASLDRIIPALGYVPGNVRIISGLANAMKNNATREQLLTFAENVIRLHGEAGET